MIVTYIFKYDSALGYVLSPKKKYASQEHNAVIAKITMLQIMIIIIALIIILSKFGKMDL